MAAGKTQWIITSWLTWINWPHPSNTHLLSSVFLHFFRFNHTLFLVIFINWHNFADRKIIDRHWNTFAHAGWKSRKALSITLNKLQNTHCVLLSGCNWITLAWQLIVWFPKRCEIINVEQRWKRNQRQFRSTHLNSDATAFLLGTFFAVGLIASKPQSSLSSASQKYELYSLSTACRTSRHKVISSVRCKRCKNTVRQHWARGNFALPLWCVSCPSTKNNQQNHFANYFAYNDWRRHPRRHSKPPKKGTKKRPRKKRHFFMVTVSRWQIAIKKQSRIVGCFVFIASFQLFH